MCVRNFTKNIDFKRKYMRDETFLPVVFFTDYFFACFGFKSANVAQSRAECCS